MRRVAFKKLDAMNERITPFLVNGLKRRKPAISAACLRLLDRRIDDPTLNARVRALLDEADPAVTEEATRFLAAHPAGDDPEYLAWSRRVMTGGTSLETRAYIDGVRRPVPAFQLEQLSGALLRLSEKEKIAAIEALGKGRRLESSRALVATYCQIRSGRLDGRLVLPLLDALKRCATIEAFGCICDNLYVPLSEVQIKAWSALGALKSHLFRLRSYRDLVELQRNLVELQPDDPRALLDLADALLLYGNDPRETREVLDRIVLDLAGETSTLAIVMRADTACGLARVAHRTGGDWRRELGRLPQEVIQPSGDYLKESHAKALLLEGALYAATGGSGTTFFLNALEIAPYDPDEPRIDNLIGSACGVSGLIWRLCRSGQVDEAGAIYTQLLEALRSDRSRSYYYPPAEKIARLDDRARSRIPLDYGFFQMIDQGDPAAAEKTLSGYVAVVESSVLWSNQERGVEAQLALGAAQIDLKRFSDAEQSLRKGITLIEGLLSAYGSATEEDDPALFEPLIERGRRLLARGLLQSASLTFLTGGPAKTIERLVGRACELAPQMEATQIAHALVLARAGKAGPAAKILTSVEDYPDQFYNKACILVALEAHDEALQHLAGHFSDSVRPGRLDLAREYALFDPDLEALKEDPRFRKLVGAER